MMNPPMRGLSADARRDLPLAAVAAVTTWLTMLSWRGFTDLWGQFLGPLMLVAVVVPVVGVVLRAAPLPRRAGALIHLLVIAVLVWLMLGGSPIHPFSSTHDLADRVGDAWVSAETYRPPIPQTVPAIAPLLIPCGALALYIVDVLACWLRRVPLAGLPLLAVYCVPISVIGTGVSWAIFLFAAAGFLLMMFLQESAHITRWGRPLGTGAVADPQGFGVRTGASKSSAATVGFGAVALGVILPLFIPTLHLDGLGLFGPGGGGDGVKVVNPIADMRRNLHRGADVPLLTVQTNDPDPSYLRIAVLTEFNGVEWTSGNRSIVSDQTASGLLPYSEQGLSGSVPIDPHNYTVTASPDFDSRWLPTPFPAESVTATGDWHWDGTTMDFIAGNDSTNTRGLRWTMTAADPKLSNYSMVNSLTAPLSIEAPYTATPSSLPSLVSTLARRVTKGSTSRFQSAVMLQNWFRTGGGFRYSLQRSDEGDNNQALLDFLARGKGHRVGYCEQFAAAFAVMARTLDMPTRVAIGFLSPKKTGTDTYVYSSHDMHAWPEVYFRGSGWVRFEPTPAIRTGSAPLYTTTPVRKSGTGKTGPKGGGRFSTDPTSSATAKDLHNQTVDNPSSSTGTHIPWVPILFGLLVLALVAAAGLVPSAVRRARRNRRLEGGAEEAWAELRDSAVDLGVSWPAGRSPHETGYLLAAWFGPEPDGAPLVRPPRGRGMALGAEDALDRIVLTLERVRYARYSDDTPGALAQDVRTCVRSLEHGCTRGALRRARWFPRSLFGRSRATARTDRGREPEAVTAGGVVDHVG
jgi:transglutaminase-like putative cysteine protease